MNSEAMTSLAQQAASTGRDDLAAFKSNPLGHAKALFRTEGRPTAISVIAWLGAIGAILAIPGALGLIAAGSLVFGPILLVLALIGAVSTLGFFGMRRWAVWIYGGQVALNLVIMIFTGFNLIALILPAIVLALCVKHYGQMK